jgi:dTDP-4-dehydrorhamnose reductase
MKKLKILVTGGGKFAFNWMLLTNSKFDNTFISRTNKGFFGDNKFITLNLTDYNKLSLIIREVKPNLIINTAAITNVDYCELYPSLCRKVNADVAVTLSQIASEQRVKFIQLSTDHFESNISDPRNEDVYPIPVNEYGSAKIKADIILQAQETNMIVRTNFFGFSPVGIESSFRYLLNTLWDDKTYLGYEDIFYTPISTPILVESISHLISIDFNGLINIVGNANLSKFDFAKKVAQTLGIGDQKIQRTAYKSTQNSIKRPKNMGLINTQLLEIFPNFSGDLDENIKRAVESFKRLLP